MSIELQNQVLEDKEIPFSELYERALQSIGKQYIPTSTEILEALKEKREHGIRKYGAACFQASLTNTMRTNAIQHAYEESLDLLNYLFHKVYVLTLEGRTVDGSLKNCISNAISCASYLSQTARIENVDKS